MLYFNTQTFLGLMTDIPISYTNLVSVELQTHMDISCTSITVYK